MKSVLDIKQRLASAVTSERGVILSFEKTSVILGRCVPPMSVGSLEPEKAMASVMLGCLKVKPLHLYQRCWIGSMMKEDAFTTLCDAADRKLLKSFRVSLLKCGAHPISDQNIHDVLTWLKVAGRAVVDDKSVWTSTLAEFLIGPCSEPVAQAFLRIKVG